MKKIIAVDDNEDLLELTRMVLKAHFDIRTTTDPSKILEMIEVDTVLVLTDREMPGMDGFELARAIKAQPNPPKVLMITGNADLNHQEEALKAGIDGFLQKPFHPKTLLDHVNALIS